MNTHRHKCTAEECKTIADILGPEELYGGGILKAYIDYEYRLDGKVCHTQGKLIAKVNGDFDDDNNKPKWLQFNLNECKEYYLVEEDDEYCGPYFEEELCYYANHSTKILELVQDPDEMYDDLDL